VRAVAVTPAGAALRWVETDGPGPVRVYLHGLGSAAAPYFSRVAAHDPRRALFVDFLGHGLSDRPAAFTATLEAHAETIATLLDHLGIRDAEVTGHSMGGSVALVLARTRPDLVGALVLVEPNLDPGPPERGAIGSRGIAAYDEDEFVASGYAETLVAAGPVWAATMRLADPRLLHRSAVALTRADLRTTLERLPVPRRLITGDAIDPAPDSLRRAGVRVETIAGAGHNVMLDAPEAFIRAGN
jgi:pimeloyl-ACP methyl ester carboxylesterase